MEQCTLVPIAIVGVSCRFPGGTDSTKRLWELLINGTNTWSHVPADRYNESAFWHPDPDDPNGSHNHLGGHFLNQDLKDFDNEFFNISPQEAAAMDPQQRILLETVYEALESAGQQQHTILGSNTSVHVALFTRDYDRNIFKDTLNIPRHQIVGNGEAIAANRISHALDLKGISVTLDTGCSGGLVAVHQACQSLRLGECEMSIAGAANLILSPDHQIGMSNLHMLSADGRSYPFDHRGSGYGRGEGFATLVLKRLDEAIVAGDPIRAVIRGSAVNQDGRTMAGITHPSSSAQATLQRRLYRQLKLDPRDVQYVEAHGTGTVAGDREEIDALAQVFCNNRSSPLFVGSVKSNLGHLESASGLAGLIKGILMLEHRQILPNADFEREKDGLRLGERNIIIPTTLDSWPHSGIARASVNSFGYGGTNAHVVLESAPGAHLPCLPQEVTAEDTPCLFVVSAKSQASLRNSIRKLHGWTLEQGTSVSLPSLSHTLCNRRTHYPWRYSWVANDHRQLSDQLFRATQTQALSLSPKDTSIHFVFTGQGAQWPGMARELLLAERVPVFIQSMHRSKRLILDLGAAWDLVEEVLRDDGTSKIHAAELAQPATTAIQIALVDLLDAIGIRPTAVIGHSSGEIAAAYAAGYISQSTALRISYYRGRVSGIREKMTTSRGAMLAVGLNAVEASEYIASVTKGTVSVACVNSPQSSTVSGDEDAIDELAAILTSNDIFNRRLRVDTAYHSHHMRAIADEYKCFMGLVRTETRSTVVSLFSTVRGKEKTDHFDADYWVDNLVSKVRFQEGMQQLCVAQTASRQIFVEIGPHNALAGPTRHCIADMPNAIQYDYESPLRRGSNAVQSFLEFVGKMFERRVPVELSTLSCLDPASKTAVVLHNLPSYSWDYSKKHWHESRLSRDYRLRKHSYHDLLGIRSPDSTSIEPRWRHMISLGTLPWLADHVVDGMTIFPGSGYLCMVIEAISQLAKDTFVNERARQITLRNVEFLKALRVPDPPLKTEVQLSFTPIGLHAEMGNALRYSFRISALAHDQVWNEHCRGDVQVEISTVEENKASNGTHKWLEDKLSKTKSKTVSKVEIYEGLQLNGNVYGPTFSGIESLSTDGDQAIATIAIPNVADTMPAKHMNPHTIHPTTLDIIMHASLPSVTQKLGFGSNMPVRINELSVSTNIGNTPGDIMSVHAKIASAYLRTAEIAIDVYDNRGPEPCLSLSGVELRLMAAESSIKETQKDARNICWEMNWGLDVDFISTENFIPPRRHREKSHSLGRKIRGLNQVTEGYIARCLSAIHSKQLTISGEYKLLYEWMIRHKQSNGVIDASQNGFDFCDQYPTSSNCQSIEMELVARTGDRLPGIITGTVNALQLVLEHDLLYKAYQDDSSALCYDLMSQYVKSLCFKKSKLRVLEIGGGTGGATLPFLKAMKDAGFSPVLYDFTDISTGFFDRAANLLSDYSINYRRLDVEKDAADQGFDPQSYDIVLACNCLHATSKIRATLENVRSLLKPDGRLLLIEVVNAQPYHHITFGTLPGYWKGTSDGRPDGPFMTVDGWRQALNAASMEMLFSVKDDDSVHISSFMIARPLELVGSNLQHPVQILSFEDSRDGLASSLRSALEDYGLDAVVKDFSHGLEDDLAVKVVLDNGMRPLLSVLTPEVFQQVCAMFKMQSRVLWISGSQESSSFMDPKKHLITGLARSAHAENANLRFISVDIQQSLEDHDSRLPDLLLRCLHRSFFQPNANGEREFIIRNNEIHIPRLLPSNRANRLISITKRPTQAAVNGHRAELSEDEIEIQVRAKSVSRMDLDCVNELKEYAGTVVAVGGNVVNFTRGDRVMAIGTSSGTSEARMFASHAEHIPDHMAYATAAALPMALMTAYYALFDLVHMQPSQRILIHGMNSFPGQVLLLIAKHWGAKVLVLATELEEMSLLKTLLQIPVECIIHDKSPVESLDAIVTFNFSGVSSHIISSLKPFGSIVHVLGGLKDAKVDLSHRLQLPPNISLHTCDIDALLQARPQMGTELLKRAAHLISTTDLPFTKLPLTIRDITQVTEEIRPAKSGRYDGKIIFETPKDLAEPVAELSESGPSLDLDATFVIAGGQGDLGQRILLQLARNGAKHLVTLSRRSQDGADFERLMAQIRAVNPDCNVHHIQCDIARENQVEAARAAIESMGWPSVRGIVQSAMVLQDRTLDSMTLQDFQVPFKTKVSGTLALQKIFGDKNLDFFIMLSSAANIVGTSGQGNYNAGNAVQDAIAHSAAPNGCHYLAFSPGMIEGTEVIRDNETRVKALSRSGFTSIWQDELDHLLEYILSPDARTDRLPGIIVGFNSESLAQAVSINGNIRSPMFTHVLDSAKHEPKKGNVTKEKSFREILDTGDKEVALSYTITALGQKLSSLISIDPEALDLEKPIFELGLDSLIAIELRNWIKREFEALLQSLEILDEQSVTALSRKIIERSKLVMEGVKNGVV